MPSATAALAEGETVSGPRNTSYNADNSDFDSIEDSVFRFADSFSATAICIDDVL